MLSTPRAEGTPNLVLDWLTADNDHWQAIVVLNSQPADLTDHLRAAADAYEEHDLYVNGYRKFARIAQVAYAAVRRYRPDVLVCWPTGFANWVCFGAWLAGLRRLLVHCGNPPTRSFHGDWMTRYVMWPLAALGAKCICCSEYVQRECQSISLVPNRLFSTVWNCTRAAEMAAAAERGRRERKGSGCCRAIMVATLERHKDHETLLRAIPMVCNRLPDFELWLVGDGTLREELESVVSALGIGNSVKLLGSRNDVGELLGQADVFVLSTTPQEGLGSVLIEALAAGLPVVASDVPACREMLRNGQYGVLVPPQNAPRLADAIVDALNSPRRPDSNGSIFAMSLSPKRMIDAYLAVALGSPAQ